MNCEINLDIAKVARAELVRRAEDSQESLRLKKKAELGLMLNQLVMERLPMRAELRRYVHPGLRDDEKARLHVQVDPETAERLADEEAVRRKLGIPRHSIPRIIEDVILLHYTALLEIGPDADYKTGKHQGAT